MIVAPHGSAVQVLVNVMDQLRVPVSRQRVIDSVVAPNAFGLRQAAESLGVVVTIGKVRSGLESLESEESDTDEVTVFQTRYETFAILERVIAGRLHVRDAIFGHRTYSLEEFKGFFSGVILQFKRARPPAERQGVLSRMWDAISGFDRARVRLAGPRASKKSAALLVGLAVTAYLVGLPARSEILSLPSAILILLFVAMAVDFVLVRIHSGSKESLRYCGFGKPSGCGAILVSAHSEILGIAWADLAFSLHTALAVTVAVLGPGSIWLVAVGLAPAVIVAAYLITAQIRMMRFCRLCNTVHVINLCCVALAVFSVWLTGEISLSLSHPVVLMLLFALSFLAVLPHIADVEAWVQAEGERRQLSKSPWNVLTMLSEAGSAALPMEGLTLQGDSSGPRLTFGLSPACGFCETVTKSLLRRPMGERVRVDLFLVPKVYSAEHCEALNCIGLEHGGKAFLEALNDSSIPVVSDPDESARLSPEESQARFAEAVRMLGHSVEELSKHRSKARTMIAEAVRISREAGATPWAVLQGRLIVGGPDLVRLIELVPPLLKIAPFVLTNAFPTASGNGATPGGASMARPAAEAAVVTENSSA